MNTSEKRRRWLRVLPYIIGGVIGLFLGLWGAATIDFSDTDMGELLLLLGLVVLSFAAGMVVHTIIHEAGHLFAGLCSGYRFVSFRVFNVMLKREDGKLRRKHYTVAGTMGQCLLSPPEPRLGWYPVILYNLGGPLANFLLSALLIALYLSPAGKNPFAAVALIVFALIGLLFGLINILPLRISGVATDGYNAVTLRRREEARRAFWVLLRVNAALNDGVRYRDMPEGWFAEPSDLRDALAASAAVLRYNLLFDRGEYREAEVLASSLLARESGMLEVQKNELRCDLLFLKLIGDRRLDELEALYTQALRQYIKVTASYPSRQRLLYAIARLWEKRSGQEERVRFDRACAGYAYTGEIASERAAFAIVDQMM